uniref:Uncharacterized protein n=1 Tax=Bracon brevicornis TaxID=1563983 RepID=A0A6V7IQ39_9HYME
MSRSAQLLFIQYLIVAFVFSNPLDLRFPPRLYLLLLIGIVAPFCLRYLGFGAYGIRRESLAAGLREIAPRQLTASLQSIGSTATLLSSPVAGLFIGIGGVVGVEWVMGKLFSYEW